MSAMLILVLGDHNKYFHLNGECVLNDLPFPVVVFTNRASAGSFEGLGPNVHVQLMQWSDFDHVRRATLELAAQRRIFAVASINEALLELAAELRTTLGLPGMAPEVVVRFRNKAVMKEMLGAAGVRVPRHAMCANRAQVTRLLHQFSRLVIKPVDGIGSRGVSFIDTEQELEKWYLTEDADGSRPYEAEEFIDGTLYHVNCIVRDGVVLLSASALYVPGMANIDFRSGAPLATVMVDDAFLQQRLEAFSARVLEVLGMVDGVTHLECFVTSDDEIVLCEVAARPGGGGVVEMIESQYGINYSLAALLLAAGRGDLLHIPEAPRERYFGVMGFRIADNCTIRKIASRDQFADPFISFVRFDAAPGRFIRASAHCADYVGLLVFSGADHEDFHAKREQLQQRFYDRLEIES